MKLNRTVLIIKVKLLQNDILKEDHYLPQLVTVYRIEYIIFYCDYSMYYIFV